MSNVEPVGRIEYELTAEGKRTGRWRPRDGSSMAVQQGMYRSKPSEKWRKGRAVGSVTEEVRK